MLYPNNIFMGVIMMDLNELDMKVIAETKNNTEHKNFCFNLEMHLAASSDLLDLRTDNNRNYLIFYTKLILLLVVLVIVDIMFPIIAGT